MASVLIVEDEHVLRLTFEQFLLEEGYTVFTASNYDEAKKHLGDATIDVVVSDIILGGKTGIALLKHISEHSEDTRVIMVTGDPNVDTASDAVRLGAFDYLAKPVTEHELKRVVRLAVTQKALEEERELYAASLDRFRRDLEAIFNGVNAGVILVDENLCLRQANGFAQELLGLSTDHETDEQLTAYLPEAFQMLESALNKAISKGRETVGIRIEWAGLPGTSRVFDATVAPIPQSDKGVEGALIIIRDITRLTWLEEQVQGDQRFSATFGKSKSMQDISQLIADLSETNSTVLICGENGTGKEVVATALHETSSRKDKAFLKVNCAALSDDILESELFGHVKGSFTGAVRDRVGRFEAADGGTILLDEIGDISPRLQLRLLRVLQSGEFERVGESQPRKVDVRVVAATNQDLPTKIQNGEFRQDLYYRLNVVRIEVPPLRERREDIPALADHFIKKLNTSMTKEIVGLTPAALDRLIGYSWPGNVRELENSIERAFIVCHDTHIDECHLPNEVLSSQSSASATPTTADHHYREIVVDKEQIVETLEQTDWNIAKTARALGMARNTLYHKMKTMEIERPAKR